VPAPRIGAAGWALLAVVLAVNVAALPREQYIGDPVAIRVETVNLLRTGTFGVPAEIATRMGRRGQYFFENRERGRWFSKYGPLNTLMYVPPLLAERVVTGELPWVSPRRLAFLNAFNLILALASAAYLLALVSLYTGDTALRWIYVLTALFATFWWNYLRAQAAEIYQTLFFLAFFFHLVRHLRGWVLTAEGGATSRFPRHLLAASAGLAALCAIKLSFLVLVPATAVVLLAAEREAVLSDTARAASEADARMRRNLVAFALPILLALALLGVVNDYKFGSPLLTGYEQLPEERDVLGGSLWTGLHGFAVTARGSVFLHFPLLVLALPGYPSLFRKRPLETVAMAVFTLALLVLNSRFRNWQGDAAYGPRYMLPVLAVAALPALEALGWIRSRLRTGTGLAAATLALLAFMWSVRLQHYVNALPFFAFQLTRNEIVSRLDAADAAAFLDRPVGAVNRDLIAYWTRGRPLTVLEVARVRLDHSDYDELRAGIDAVRRSNYLWFDGGL
jgi:hypothetical protein